MIRHSLFAVGLAAAIGLIPAPGWARGGVRSAAVAPSDVALSYSPDHAGVGVQITVPGRKPLYAASLVPRYDKDHRLVLVELVLERIGDKGPRVNLLAAPGDSQSHQPFQFYPSDFAPGVKKPVYTGHRVILARSIRMRLLLNVVQSSVQPQAAANGRAWRFQVLTLRLSAQDLGRRP